MRLQYKIQLLNVHRISYIYSAKIELHNKLYYHDKQTTFARLGINYRSIFL